MKNILILTCAITFSIVNCGEIIQDHMGSIQHKKLTRDDGPFYLVRTMEQNTLEATRSALAALPEDQRVGQFFPISVLAGNRYREVRMPIGRYFNLMLQLKQITPTAKQQAALERLIYGDLPPQPHRNTNLSIIR